MTGQGDLKWAYKYVRYMWAGVLGIVALSVLMILVVAVMNPGSGTGQAGGAEPEVNSTNELVVTSNDWTACRDRAYVEDLLRYINDRDDRAYSRAVAFGRATKICIPLKAGDTYLLQDTKGGLLQIRQKGELETYWTISGALK